MIGDSDLKVSKLYNMLPADEPGTSEGRTAATNATVRSVFIVGPDKKIKLMLTYPMTTGRNFDEILRVLDSMQLTAKHKVATPANWKQGDDVIISGWSQTTTRRSCFRPVGRRQGRTCASSSSRPERPGAWIVMGLPMILREWRGRASPSEAEAYPTHFRANVLAELARIPGFLGAQLSKRQVGDKVEFLVLTR